MRSRVFEIKQVGVSFGLITSVGLILYGCGGGGGSQPSPAPSPSKDTHAFGAVLPSKASVSAAPKPLLFGAAATPSTASLTSNPALPPVGDQLQSPSCTAWATGYGMASWEAAISSSSSSNTPDHQASPSDLFWKTLLKMGGAPCTSGTDPKVALDILVNDRVAGMNTVAYSEACGSPSSSTTFGITAYRILNGTDTDTIKNAIATNHPVAIAANVYTDFQRWGIGSDRTGVYQGNGIVEPGVGHCMLVVGYDDSRNAWRIQNSWGTGWGDNGRFWMSYAAFANTVVAAYVAEGGNNVNPSPSPGGTVTFTAFDALQYQSVSTGVYYIVHPFTLSEPLLVTQGRLTYENTGGTTGWIPVNQVMYSTYVWWSSASPFPAGNYSVEIQGTTKDGRNVTVKGTHALSNGGFVRSAPQHVEASQSVLKVIKSLGGTPATTANLLPGMQVVVNGHAVTLKSK